MGRTMKRGKQQVLLGLLPGKTIDFEKASVFAKISRIRGTPRHDLNIQLVLRKIRDQIAPWDEGDRPVFRNLESSADRFVLIEPSSVAAELYPLVFMCSNHSCGIVTQYRDEAPNSSICTHCHSGRLSQLRFIKVHRCGEIEPLAPFACQKCHSRKIALDTRSSERVQDFRWLCRSCGTSSIVFGGKCSACDWPGTDKKLKNMNIEVHRTQRTFFSHNAVLLNQPGQELSAFLNVQDWQSVAAAAYFELPEMKGRHLADFANQRHADQGPALTLSDNDRERFKAQGMSADVIRQFEEMQAQLGARSRDATSASSSTGIASTLAQRTGLEGQFWDRAGQEMIEAVIPRETGRVLEIDDLTLNSLESILRARGAMSQWGLDKITLAQDFPITTATFGYSRTDFVPGACRLRSFPPDIEHGGKFPIFVDVVQADAIILRFSYERILAWLRANLLAPILPVGSDPTLSARAYFVRLFDDIRLSQVLNQQQAEARMVFGLLHTFSHLAIRRAALLSGLEGPSLSEYLLPKTLSFAIYCNHRFGGTIGALSALFEQSLPEWMGEIRESRRCVYDPICIEKDGSCHACSQLSETSCKFFNVNLGRQFLFGGHDPVLGNIRTGFLVFARGL
jgi:hypothetical protein